MLLAAVAFPSSHEICNLCLELRHNGANVLGRNDAVLVQDKVRHSGHIVRVGEIVRVVHVDVSKCDSRVLFQKGLKLRLCEGAAE